jgi:hypothetical protein
MSKKDTKIFKFFCGNLFIREKTIYIKDKPKNQKLLYYYIKFFYFQIIINKIHYFK